MITCSNTTQHAHLYIIINLDGILFRFDFLFVHRVRTSFILFVCAMCAFSSEFFFFLTISLICNLCVSCTNIVWKMLHEIGRACWIYPYHTLHLINTFMQSNVLSIDNGMLDPT